MSPTEDRASFTRTLALKLQQEMSLRPCPPLRVYSSSPQSAIVILLEVRPDCEPKDSTFLITSIPSFTLPKTTCLPSSLNEERRRLLSLPLDCRTIPDAPSRVRLPAFCWVMPPSLCSDSAILGPRSNPHKSCQNITRNHSLHQEFYSQQGGKKALKQHFNNNRTLLNTYLKKLQ